jgi:hypothetical protein
MSIYNFNKKEVKLVKDEKLAKLLKKKLGYCFEVKICDDPQCDFCIYLDGRLNNNAILQLDAYRGWDVPYRLDILVWQEYPLMELRWNDDCSAETAAELIKVIKEQYSRLKEDFKYLETKRCVKY